MAVQARARSRSPVAREAAGTPAPGPSNRELECAICTEQFVLPKLLHCMHSFCNRCVELLLNRSPNRQSVTCPVCRHVTKVGVGGTSELWRNHILEKEVKVHQIALMRSNNQLKCGECETETATRFCSDCRIKFCDPCATHHSRLARSRDHPIVNITEVANEQLFDRVGERCAEHNQENLHYCGTCQRRACVGCIHSPHHQGHVFRPLPQVLETQFAALQTKLQRSELLCDQSDQHLRKIDQLWNYSRITKTASRMRVEDTFRMLATLLEQEKAKYLRWLDEPTEPSDQAVSKARLKMRHTRALTEYVREATQLPKEDIQDILQGQELSHWGTEVGNMEQILESRPAIPDPASFRFSPVGFSNARRQIPMAYEVPNDLFVNVVARKIIPNDNLATGLKSLLKQSIVLNEAAYPGPSGMFSFGVDKTRLRVGTEGLTSPVSSIGDFKWSIIVEKHLDFNGPNIGIFVKCQPRRYTLNWQCVALAEITLKSQSGNADVTQAVHHTWTSNEDSGMGISPFIPWNELIDPGRGYVVNGIFTVDTKIQIFSY